MKSWILLPILAVACMAAQADYFRWMDAEGKVHYSDQPPPANITQVERVKATGGKPSEVPLPYALQQAVTNFPVTLYSSECGDACRLARELLACETRNSPYRDGCDGSVGAGRIEENYRRASRGSDPDNWQ